MLGSVSVLTRCYCSVFNVHTPVLKALRLGAVTREAGKAFHCSRVLGKKLYLRYVFLSRGTRNELECIFLKCLLCGLSSLTISTSMSRNKLKLNRDKTELLVISSKYRPRSSLDSILVGDHRVNRSDKARNIGVAFDETLSLDKHVSSVCKSALFHLWNIAKIRMYLTSDSTKTLVYAYVTCRLDNCNSLLLGSPKYMIQKLQRVQNCAARLVAGQPRAAHIRPVLKELHWLPVEQRITFKVLLLTFKALNNLAPPYLSQLIVPYNPTRNLRSAGKHLLEVPNVRLKSYGDRAFSVAAPKHWNEIPLDIKLSRSVDVFKSRLKTYLFRLAFN